MARVFISEFVVGAGNLPQVPEFKTQVLEVGAEPVASERLDPATTVIRIHVVDDACYVVFGGRARAHDMHFSADSTEYFAVRPGTILTAVAE